MRATIALIVAAIALVTATAASARWESGGPGDDVLVGTAAPDQFYGEGGNDLLEGRAANDYLEAGPDDDRVLGGSGGDLALGGTGADVIALDGGLDVAYAGAGDDSVSGGSGNDVIFGQVGSDTLSGGIGRDRIYGGVGADSIEGGSAADMIVASPESAVNAGPGNDRVILQEENREERGSAADAPVRVRAGSGNDFVDSRDGRQTTVLCGPGRDTVRADAGDVTRGCERSRSARRRR